MTKQIPENLLEKYRYGENNPLIDVLEDFIKTSENGILELSTPPGSAKSFSTQEVAKNLLSLEFSQTSHPIDHLPRFIFCVHIKYLRDETQESLLKYFKNNGLDVNVLVLTSFEDSLRKCLGYIWSQLTKTQETTISFKDLSFQNLKAIACWTREKLEDRFKSDLTEPEQFKEFEDAMLAMLSTNKESELIQSSLNQYGCDTLDIQKRYECELSLKKNKMKKALFGILRNKYTFEDETTKELIFDKWALANDFEKNKDIVQYEWICLLYPDVLASRSDIIVMTHDKFLHPLSDPAFGGKPIHETEFFLNGDVTTFIDESNQFFSKVQKYQLDALLKSPFNLKKIVQQIRDITLNVQNSSSENGNSKKNTWMFFEPFDKKKNPNFKIIEKLNNDYDELKKEINPHCGIRNDLNESVRVFSMSEYWNKFSNLSNEKYILEYSEDAIEYRLIEKKDMKTSKDIRHVEIKTYVQAMNTFIDNFCHTLFYQIFRLYIFAKNSKFKNRIVDSQTTTYSQAITSGKADIDFFKDVLANFLGVLNQEENSSLYKIIERYIEKQLDVTRGRKSSSLLDTDDRVALEECYFSSIEINSNINDSINTEINRSFVDVMPEDFLGTLAIPSRVVSISATNNDPSILNFNHEWLRQRVTYYEVSAKDMMNINAYNQSRNRYASDIQRSFQYIVGKEEDLSDDKKWMKNIVSNIFKQKLNSLTTNKDDVSKLKLRFMEMYLKIIQNIDFFVNHDDVYTYLNMYSRNVDMNDFDLMNYNWELNRTLINDLFKAVCKHYNLNEEDFKINKSDFFMILRNTPSDDNESQLNKQIDSMKSRHFKGKKTFVFSTYAAASVGVNICLDISEHEKDCLIPLNDFGFSLDRVDINALYLDRPTNFLSAPKNTQSMSGSASKEYDLERYVYQSKIMRMKNLTSEITEKEANSYNAALSNGRKQAYLNRPSCYHYVLEKIIQATGRIDRSNLKHPNIYFNMDDSIKIPQYIIDEWGQDMMLSSDMEFVLDNIKDKTLGATKEECLKFDKFKAQIESVCSRGGTYLKRVQNPIRYDNFVVQNVEDSNNLINQHIVIKDNSEKIKLRNKNYHQLYINCGNLRRHGIDYRDLEFKILSDRNGDVLYEIKKSTNIVSSKTSQQVRYTSYGKLFSQTFRNILNNEEIKTMLQSKGFQVDMPDEYDFVLIPQALFKLRGNLGEALIEEYFRRLNYELTKTLKDEQGNIRYDTYEKIDFYCQNDDGSINFAVECKNWTSDELCLEDYNAFFNKYLKRMKDLNIEKLVIANTFSCGNAATDATYIVNSLENLAPENILVIPYIIDDDGNFEKIYAQKIRAFVS